MKENKNTISTAAVQYATVQSLNTEVRTRTNADSQIRTTIQVLSDDYEDFKENWCWQWWCFYDFQKWG